MLQVFLKTATCTAFLVCVCTYLKQSISNEAEIEVLASSSDGSGCILSLVNRCEVKQGNIGLFVVIEL